MTTFYYMSGEEVRVGDIVTVHGERAVIESVISKGTEDARDWSCFETGGVMIEVEGCIELWNSTDNQEDLEFIRRANAPA